MSHHRYPICPTSGKVRYGNRKDVKLEMRHVDRDRSRARLNQMTCSRREVRSYECPDCSGWHLTSKPARPMLLISAPTFAARVPGPAAQAILRMVATNGIRVPAAA